MLIGARSLLTLPVIKYEFDMENKQPSSIWFLFYKDQLFLRKKNGVYALPTSTSLPMPVADLLSLEETLPFDEEGELAAYAGSVTAPGPAEEGWEWVGLRASWDLLDADAYRLAGKAFELIHWDRNSRYCSACGSPMQRATPISKRCGACGIEVYPHISTAVLVLVRKDDQLLLVHARNFKGSFYSLVAGFLEAGETLEECVAREVKEETGLDIKNITYWGNQPWPYPSGLMVGFVADYAGGEIRLQNEELSAGAFYTKDCLPELPRRLSLARKMIDWWLSTSR